MHLTEFSTGNASPGFTNERRVPPPHLLAFLAHIQVSYDAAYISSAPIVEEPQTSVTISPPPTSRTTSLLGPSRRPRSIFPPTTPHPVPSVGESDRKYVKSEGTPLTAGIWGDSPDEEFQLLWSRKEKAWVAVFKLVVNVGTPLLDTRLPVLRSLSLVVAFVRMYFEDPLLCLTVSATLREKPIPLTGPRKRLAELITAAGNDPFDPTSPLTPILGQGDETDPTEALARGLDEVNLLGGIASGGPSSHWMDAFRKFHTPSKFLHSGTTISTCPLPDWELLPAGRRSPCRLSLLIVPRRLPRRLQRPVPHFRSCESHIGKLSEPYLDSKSACALS